MKTINIKWENSNMPLYTDQIDLLKKELLNLRKFNTFHGYESNELSLDEYTSKSYKLSPKVLQALSKFKQETLNDVKCFTKNEGILNLNNSIDFNINNSIDEELSEDLNYFNAPELELSFDRVNFQSPHYLKTDQILLENTEVSDTVKKLDKIFTYEIQRIKERKTSLVKTVLVQKLTKVQEKIKADKLNEASVLMSRFYSESKQDIVIGYLYFEILYAKAGLGNYKSLSKARYVANNVCFLTDKSDEMLVSYYRYIHVCREFSHDQERALQLFREFVLLSNDTLLSSNFLENRNGFFVKCLMLFLLFDINKWNIYEIESLQNFSLKAVSGSVFYLAFMRNTIIKHLDSKRYGSFLQIEIYLNDIQESHAKLIKKIQDEFMPNGLPQNGSKEVSTIGQKYLHDLFLGAKIPTFSDYLVNTSLTGVHYITKTKNDEHLSSMGLSEHSFWRAWISKISPETSLQRADIIPIEQVLNESALLIKYNDIIQKLYDYELEIFNKEEYKESKDFLEEVTAAGIMKVILGENSYSVFEYGMSWNGLKEYFSNIKLSRVKKKHYLISEVLIYKGKNGLFWNLEEIQMMLESVSLIIDNKNIGIMARLEQSLEKKSEKIVNNEYMSLSEHLELYWWIYILIISLSVFIFNIMS
jgi:hypothetical protein